jgi:hypothetical protein
MANLNHQPNNTEADMVTQPHLLDMEAMALLNLTMVNLHMHPKLHMGNHKVPMVSPKPDMGNLLQPHKLAMDSPRMLHMAGMDMGHLLLNQDTLNQDMVNLLLHNLLQLPQQLPIHLPP